MNVLLTQMLERLRAVARADRRETFTGKNLNDQVADESVVFHHHHRRRHDRASVPTTRRRTVRLDSDMSRFLIGRFEAPCRRALVRESATSGVSWGLSLPWLRRAIATSVAVPLPTSPRKKSGGPCRGRRSVQ